MQKKLWIPVVMLLATCIFLAGRSVGSADSLPATPQIIRRVALTNQTGAVSATTLFTPSHNGLYRVTTYMTQTSGQVGAGSYTFDVNWTDDAGQETAGGAYLELYQIAPPQAYGLSIGDGVPGGIATIEAVAGQPVTYDIRGTGGPYSLYITVERLAP